MRPQLWPLLLIVGLVLFTGACTPPSSPEETATPTPTPTPAAATEIPPSATPTAVIGSRDPDPTPTSAPTATPTPEASANPCAGLSGELETQIMVGPAEVVGLEPVAVGSIPFAITSDEPPYTVEGQGSLSYEDVLQQEWGTYSVSLEMDGTVNGVCTEEDGTPMLDLTITMSGEQMVEVSVGGQNWQYPWSGEHSLNLSFPLEDGANAEGEGWSFVLHLD